MATRERETWEDEYLAGSWDYLTNLEEVAHYAVTLGFLLHTHKNRNVLDVGCGEALLLNYLRICGYQQYLGLDISQVAISRNLPKMDDKTHFFAVDVEQFSPLGSFDCIVYSECLYYFLDPIEVVDRYRLSLSPGGIFVVSLFLDDSEPARRKIVERIQLKFVCLESVTLNNARGKWNCCLFATETLENARPNTTTAADPISHYRPRGTTSDACQRS